MTRFAALLLMAVLATTARPLAAQTLEDYDYENLEFRGIGIELGSVFPAQVESALSFGVRGDLGLLGPNVRIVPGIVFWSSELKRNEVNRLADQIVRVCERQPGAACPSTLNLGEVRRSDLTFNADAHYEFVTPYVTTPYLGAGVGVHWLNGSGEFIDDTFIEDLLDAITPAINLIAGADVLLTDQLRFFAEGRVVLVSDVRHAALSVGGVWTFAAPIPVPRVSADR